MKKIAVLVYVPNKEVFIQQFFALYSSVMLNPRLKETLDFLIACEVGMEHLFERNNCRLVYLGDLSNEPQYRYLYDDKPYVFINSWAHFTTEESINTILQYEYSLRIDVDTFIFPNLVGLEVDENTFFTGIGGYIGEEETKTNLKRIAIELDLQQRGLSNIGSTWFAHSMDVIEIGIKSLEIAGHLLRKEFKEEGEWPKWYAPVISLYAGELALNNSEFQIDICDRFDANSTSAISIKEVYTVHCWHTTSFFSKHKYVSGEYVDRLLGSNIDELPEYSFLMTRISELLYDGKPILKYGVQQYTPKQAMITGVYLIWKSLPHIPRTLWNKIRRIFG